MNLLSQAPTIEFCEKAGTGIIARPFYALSNLAYPFVAFLILKKSRDFLALSFAAALTLVGTLSFIYDANPSRLTQLFDLFGMYVIIGLLLSVNLSRYLKNTLLKSFLYVIPVIITALFATFFLKGQSGNIIFGIFIVKYLGLEILLKQKQKPTNFKLWLTGLGIFVIGFAIWILDVTKVYCDPTNVLNGRGIFHVLTATTVYLLYLYYASNQSKFGLK